MIKSFEDTICAISTPAGNGAIAVIRLSGNKAIQICDQVFKSKGKRLGQCKGNTIHHGFIGGEGKIIDEVLVSLFKSPHSYSGEDMVEISCHGSPYIQQAILQLLIQCGTRLAGPGEFTQRAFLNGKMDLSQAEAVADLIASSSEAFHRIAINQMRGGFSDEIARLRGQLLEFITLIELELDFSEEDVEFADRSRLNHLIEQIHSRISTLLNSFAAGNVIKNGIPVVIAGLSNAGKSTLLNMFLNEERAIVSEIPGTTRDVIEDQLHLEGYLFRFIDTAGLRHTEDKIEMIGIRKTYEKLRQARIILLIADSSDPIEEIESQVIALKPDNQQKIILLLNKMDKVQKGIAEEKSGRLSEKLGIQVIPISAKKGINTEHLKKALVHSIQQDSTSDANVTVTNLRHYEALTKADEASKRIIEGIGNGLAGDLLAQDIREILHYLGEITGEITNDEILGNIFANFCIGK